MRSVTLAFAAVLALAGPAAAAHLASISDAEFACQTAVASAVKKLSTAVGKCVRVCRKAVRTGTASPADCLPPFGPATQACMDAAMTRAKAAPEKACGLACPSCFGPACDVEGLLAAWVAPFTSELPTMLCDDSASPDGITAGEMRCQDTLVALLPKIAPAYAAALISCNRFMHRELPDSRPCELLLDPGGKPRDLAIRNKISSACRDAFDVECLGSGVNVFRSVGSGVEDVAETQPYCED